jgi:2-polyprenyl-3-methyl-5-hydroxy-6-metoxy-1,4-benzoquinol methylase
MTMRTWSARALCLCCAAWVFPRPPRDKCASAKLPSLFVVFLKKYVSHSVNCKWLFLNCRDSFSMEISEAIDLIRFNPGNNRKQKWADLGCGDGLFTKALASLLSDGSSIHAIDRDKRAIRKIPDEYEGVIIEKSVMDFTSEEVVFQEMDGFIMANSLHYVKDKQPFVIRMLDSLKVGGLFFLIDYDMNTSNTWVPYPVPIEAAEKLFLSCGAESFTILNKRRSVFGNRWMYAALVSK